MNLFNFNTRARKLHFIDEIECALPLGGSLSSFLSLHYGTDAEIYFNRFKINSTSLIPYRGRISQDRFVRMLETLATDTGDEAFGVKYGAYFPLGDDGPFGLAMLNAPSAAKALELYFELAALLMDYLTYTFKKGPEYTTIEWNFSPLIQQPDQLEDFCICLGARYLRLYMGSNWVHDKLYLRRSAPENLSFHLQHLTPNLIFGHDFSGTIMSNASLAMTRPQADPRVFFIMRELAISLIKGLRPSRDIVNAARHAIISQLKSGNVKLPFVAKAINTSERSLQRRLAEKKLTFDLLVEEMRSYLSEQLLRRPQLSMSEIALSCGYSSPAAYSRAVKTWHGLTPGELRRRIMVDLNKSNQPQENSLTKSHKAV